MGLRQLKKFLKDERGQSTTEYILILSVVVMIAMKFRNEFGKRISGILSNLTGKIDNAVNDSDF